MKKIIITNLLFISGLAFSQVIISGPNGTAETDKKEAVLLEFEAGLNKGIILPYTRTLPSGTGLEGGTIVLDASTGTAAKVKYYAPSNPKADANGWIDLSSGNTADISSALAKQPLPTGPDAVTEDPPAKTIIGAASSSAKGVLVLESKSKVLLLPRVASTDDVKNPAPGMMVYVTGAKKRLAVFNGANWTFWAANP